MNKYSKAAKAQDYPVLLELLTDGFIEDNDLSLEEDYINFWVEVDSTTALVHLEVVDEHGNTDGIPQPDTWKLVSDIEQYLMEAEIEHSEYLLQLDSL